MATTTTDQSKKSSTNFEKRLLSVNNTQESVQTLSLWILHHRTQYERLLKIWFKILKKSKSSHRLTLFYVANDVIQNAKRHNALIYPDAFKFYLNSSMIYIKENSIKKKVQRILQIWRERGVYDEEFIDELLKKLLGDEIYEKDKETTRVMNEFQPKFLCESLNRFKQLEGERFIKEQRMNSDMKFLEEISVENIRKLKDKTSIETYHVEYENCREKFEEYIQFSQRCLQERKLIKLNCEQAGLFYDAQYQDANIVVEAYKSFGDKIATLKNKLDSVIKDLPATVSSPGNTPPDYRQTDMDLSDNEENASKSSTARTAIVRTTRLDPRHNRKHNNHRNQYDADERSHQNNRKSSPLIDDQNKTSGQETSMIDVNLITDLLIQHSQSTGFDKSLEMLTNTLRQLTESNVSTGNTNQLLSSSSNPLENLLINRLQPSNPSSQTWFNSQQSQFTSTTPSFYSPSANLTDFQYQNQRN